MVFRASSNPAADHGEGLIDHLGLPRSREKAQQGAIHGPDLSFRSTTMRCLHVADDVVHVALGHGRRSGFAAMALEGAGELGHLIVADRFDAPAGREVALGDLAGGLGRNGWVTRCHRDRDSRKTMIPTRDMAAMAPEKAAKLCRRATLVSSVVSKAPCGMTIRSRLPSMEFFRDRPPSTELADPV